VVRARHVARRVRGEEEHPGPTEEHLIEEKLTDLAAQQQFVKPVGLDNRFDVPCRGAARSAPRPARPVDPIVCD
jgi:hypothetical protein